MKPYQKLERFWTQTGVALRSQALSVAQIARLELNHKLSIPADFRDYLLSAHRPDGDEWDAHCCAWWGADRITSVQEEYEHDIGDRRIVEVASKCLFFVDHMDWCMAWAINCSNGPRRGQILIISEKDRYVARSFSDFVDQFVTDIRTLM